MQLPYGSCVLLALREFLKSNGANDPKTIEAVETFVETSCEAASYMIDKLQERDAAKTLEECVRVLKSEVKSSYPRLLYKIYYKQAELQNANGLH